MISHLKGRLLENGPGHAVVEVGGVGLEVKVPAGAAQALPAPGETVTLYTHLHIREDEISLYGFATAAERELFRTLQGVSGVGPRLALAIVGGCPPARFWQAVLRQDASLLGGISGVGRKTVSRLLVELRDRVPAAAARAVQAAAAAGPAAAGETVPGPAAASAVAAAGGTVTADGSELAAARDQARDALSALGYSHREAAEAVAAALEAAGPEVTADDVIVAALRWLGRQGRLTEE
ncbi:MAG: Holliday junction branch migration protein RuvA [Bacillota bacterium]|nr:Holliday junction branch migration protein RuvA [Bacillota bacterium]